MADTILNQLADAARQRTARAKERVSAAEMAARAEGLGSDGTFPFEEALRKDGMSFICECKKASPSRGLIAPEFPYLEIAREYEAAGADAVSVLTEPQWFLGQDAYLKEIAAAVKIPCLRKDFTVDAYMYPRGEGPRRPRGAADLRAAGHRHPAAVHRPRGPARPLLPGRGPHENEIASALAAGARIVGVNNRNLKDFTVDTGNAQRLRSLVPPEVLFVAESGIRTAEDVRAMREAGADACLIGETLMRADDKAAMLAELRG